MNNSKSLLNDQQTQALFEMLGIKSNEAESIRLFKSDFESKLDEYNIYLKRQEKAPKTIQPYMRVARFLMDNFTSDDKGFTKDDLLDYKAKIKELYSNSNTVNQYITLANRFLYFCGYTAADMVKKEKVQTKNVIDEVISDSEFKRLLRWCRKLGYYDMEIVMKTIAYTGIRIEELKFFTAEEFENKNAYIIQVENKGKKRDVILNHDLASELRKYCKDNGIVSGRIITLSYSTIWRRMKRIAGKSKVSLTKVHPHAFRHYFAIKYMEAFGDPGGLANLLGHNNQETTRIYTKLTSEGYREQLDVIWKKGE